ncbi:MAG: hypothetical protein H0T71_02680 [Acidobacteria bacterium]|nr:hypothetical protein [Acidobacteriota bacterium]
MVVTIRVERPRRYFDDDPTVRLLAGETVVGETTFEDSDLWSVTIPLDVMLASGGRVSITTSHTFVPAEQGPSSDRRHLGLRVFGVNVAVQD